MLVSPWAYKVLKSRQKPREDKDNEE